MATRTISDPAQRDDGLAGGGDAELSDIELLQRISAEMTREDAIETLYEKITDAAVLIMRSDYASMQMLYPGRGGESELHLLAFRGFSPHAAKFWERVRADSESTCGVALRTGTRVIAPDVERCDFMAGTEDLTTYLQTGIRAVQTTPLFSRTGAMVGMISTHWREPHQPSERDLRLLDILARQAADIIERTRAAEALRHRGEQFETLLNQAPLGVYLVDADLRIRQVNPIARSVFGDIPGGVIGRDFDEIIHLLWDKTYAEEIVRVFRHTLSTGEPYVVPERAELRIDRGITEYYEWRLDRITLPDGRHGLVCYFRDISQQVHARLAIAESEERLRALVEELKDQDRRKDEFLATLAHELRNPLAPIRTGLQVLKLARSEETAEKARAMMDRQIAHMVRLIDDLLDVSRVNRGKVELKRERVDIRTVIEAAIEVSRPLIDAGRHGLFVSLPKDPLLLDVDPTRMAQVVSNLLNNAAKYTPEEGRIELSAERDGDRVVLRVRDNGTGIPRDMLPRVFDLFTQVGRSLHRAQGGLGIGLSLVRKLVEMHGGVVAGESAGVGHGSTFTVRLPLAAAEARPDAAVPEPNGAVLPLPGLRILVVDDNVDGAESLSLLLALGGHETAVAHSGPEALEMDRRFRSEVVFLDIGLPEMNGYEVAKRFREETASRRTVLVALTGWGSEEDKRQAMAAGFQFHVIKPVDIATVESVLTQVRGALAG
jgi:PAS domain S-box-containing protein